MAPRIKMVFLARLMFCGEATSVVIHVLSFIMMQLLVVNNVIDALNLRGARYYVMIIRRQIRH